jgi:hypothetical protein
VRGSLTFISGSELTEETTVSYLERLYPSLGEMSLPASIFLGSLLLSPFDGMALLSCGGTLEWGIIGGRMLGVVRLIFCFFMSASVGLAAGTSLAGTTFSSS